MYLPICVNRAYEWEKRSLCPAKNRGKTEQIDRPEVRELYYTLGMWGGEGAYPGALTEIW